jgi:hypothetical protein
MQLELGGRTEPERTWNSALGSLESLANMHACMGRSYSGLRKQELERN